LKKVCNFEPWLTLFFLFVKMVPGDEISLGRSSEVAIDGLPEGQTPFEWLDRR
jgi:hypothetical protein